MICTAQNAFGPAKNHNFKVHEIKLYVYNIMLGSLINLNAFFEILKKAREIHKFLAA